jgi:exodeoxyribonuclease VIII
MLDLETLDNGPTAAIVAIGAVMFDHTGTDHLNTFYSPVRVQSSIDAGLTVNGSTIERWMEQSDAARAVFSEHAPQLAEILQNFADWLPGHCKLWGNGASFDNAILSNAYRAVGHIQPWAFWDDRCYRTAVAGVTVKREQLGTHHNALDDARSQAEHLIAWAPQAIC